MQIFKPQQPLKALKIWPKYAIFILYFQTYAKKNLWKNRFLDLRRLKYEKYFAIKFSILDPIWVENFQTVRLQWYGYIFWDFQNTYNAEFERIIRKSIKSINTSYIFQAYEEYIWQIWHPSGYILSHKFCILGPKMTFNRKYFSNIW